MEGGLTRIDWAAPWFDAWRGVVGTQAAGAAQPDAPDALDTLNALAGAAAPVRFAPQDALPPGVAYEQFIADTAHVPTRPGLHDFFNAIAWIGLPRTKRAMNRLQAAEIAARGVGAVRGPVRDALTVFDENGALLHAPEPLWQALLARQWRRLFVELRPLWAQARLVLLGHALMEKLAAAPHKSVTAHVWRVPAPPLDGLATADAWLAPQITGPALAAKPFTPLPVLGVPGWWADNQNFRFYDDSMVFRPARAAQA